MKHLEVILLKIKQYKELQKLSAEYFEKAAIAITDKERENIEVSDFGLDDIYNTGLQLVVYINTDRVCAKEMVVLPHQTCPEHSHPQIDGKPGKEETFRCRWGKAYLYVAGKETENPKCKAPKGKEACYTVWHEILLSPGEEYTIVPETLHWFQAGEEGAVISEFSTKCIDEKDIFTDPEIARLTKLS